VDDEKPAQPATSSPAHTERGAYGLLKAVYKEKGFAGWYQGLTAQILKAALCQGEWFAPCLATASRRDDAAASNHMAPA